MAIWYILKSFGIFLPVLVFYQEKSGNPARLQAVFERKKFSATRVAKMFPF
jgi:hypothetical protein